MSDNKTIVIIGLGNPGDEYKNTRHNLGFEVVDFLAKESGLSFKEEKNKYEWLEMKLNEFKIILIKPLTYMNLSGRAVLGVMSKFKISPSQILVIYDDISLSLGVIRFRPSGSAGGHNGIRSVIENIGQEFNRMKIGIDDKAHGTLTGYVLGKFTPEERNKIDLVVEKMPNVINYFLVNGMEATMNKFNIK